MPVRYWVGVVSGNHVATAVAEGICAFSHGKKAPIDTLADGDRIALYSPKTGYKEGDIIQCFTALGTVIDARPTLEDHSGIEIWQARAAYANLPHTPVRPLLEKLSFITNPSRWGMGFRRSFFEINQADFTVIETAMKAQI